MLVLHVHIMGKSGNIERTYDFLRNDGKETLEGCDVVIPYNEEYTYPLSEDMSVAILRNRDLEGDH
jgi:hypothetical protein